MIRFFIISLMFIVSCINLTGCDGGPQSPATPGQAERKIIFQSVRDAPLGSEEYQANYQKYFELYTLNEEGSRVQRITDNLFWENQPDVSPDGQTLLFSLHEFRDAIGPVEDTDPGWEIAVMDIDGSSLTKLTNNCDTSTHRSGFSN